jgi:hypothetical protein
MLGRAVLPPQFLKKKKMAVARGLRVSGRKRIFFLPGILKAVRRDR